MPGAAAAATRRMTARALHQNRAASRDRSMSVTVWLSFAGADRGRRHGGGGPRGGRGGPVPAGNGMAWMGKNPSRPATRRAGLPRLPAGSMHRGTGSRMSRGVKNARSPAGHSHTIIGEEPVVTGAEGQPARPDDRSPLAFGGGAPLVEREEDRQGSSAEPSRGGDHTDMPRPRPCRVRSGASRNRLAPGSPSVR